VLDEFVDLLAPTVDRLLTEAFGGFLTGVGVGVADPGGVGE
jgi:hypothetical protein